jgi:diadenosine tetraphosphatase ApaH/serine/threonine PP2A family protein phosphatase
MAEEVLAVLEAEGIPCQMGNHEAMLVGRLPLPVEKDAVYGLSALRSRLSPERLASISAWPTRRVIAIGGRKLVLLHGGPRDELSEYVYPDSDLTRFAELKADVVAVGHSHFPFVRAVGSTRVIGVGSCGLPRDVGDMASCALYDPGSDVAESVRVRFDAERVLAEARTAGPVHASVAGVMRRREIAPRVPGAGNA